MIGLEERRMVCGSGEQFVAAASLPTSHAQLMYTKFASSKISKSDLQGTSRRSAIETPNPPRHRITLQATALRVMFSFAREGPVVFQGSRCVVPNVSEVQGRFLKIMNITICLLDLQILN